MTNRQNRVQKVCADLPANDCSHGLVDLHLSEQTMGLKLQVQSFIDNKMLSGQKERSKPALPKRFQLRWSDQSGANFSESVASPVYTHMLLQPMVIQCSWYYYLHLLHISVESFLAEISFFANCLLAQVSTAVEEEKQFEETNTSKRVTWWVCF